MTRRIHHSPPFTRSFQQRAQRNRSCARRIPVPAANMLSEGFVTSIRAQPKSANTAIAKDVGIYLHELHPNHTIKSSFKKSSTPVNALAVSATHLFAAQADKAVVHVYSRERGNQESLVSFPERIHSLTLIGDGVLALGTSEGRIILWEVSLCSTRGAHNATLLIICRFVLAGKYRPKPRIYNQSRVWQRVNRILPPDPRTRTSMYGLSHVFCLCRGRKHTSPCEACPTTVLPSPTSFWDTALVPQTFVFQRAGIIR